MTTYHELRSIHLLQKGDEAALLLIPEGSHIEWNPIAEEMIGTSPKDHPTLIFRRPVEPNDQAAEPHIPKAPQE